MNLRSIPGRWFRAQKAPDWSTNLPEHTPPRPVFGNEVRESGEGSTTDVFNFKWEREEASPVPNSNGSVSIRRLGKSNTSRGEGGRTEMTVSSINFMTTTPGIVAEIG
uniref:Uncharacterized protein n=1 Tax=Octactis speculum TaxID=3111310 RepID=A0A7S2C401_9STRA|mmetsp:Transcript_31103/g.42155  ORF Transcript_31103/g.42155 Transcript_31103/m.42155 type:complete len:108 (+) Transcript_31103:1183-1506(+)